MVGSKQKTMEDRLAELPKISAGCALRNKIMLRKIHVMWHFTPDFTPDVVVESNSQNSNTNLKKKYLNKQLNALYHVVYKQTRNHQYSILQCMKKTTTCDYKK